MDSFKVTSAFEERMWKTLIPRRSVMMARAAVMQWVVHTGTDIFTGLKSENGMSQQDMPRDNDYVRSPMQIHPTSTEDH